MANIQKIENIILTSQHGHIPFGVDVFYKADHQKKPVILFIHGFNGFKDWGHFPLIGKEFAQKGFLFVSFNLSHNGTSLEHPTEFVNLEAYGNDLFSTDLDDTGLVIDYLFSDDFEAMEEADLELLFIIGHSRGGAVTMLKAGEDPRVKGICTWASIKSTRHFWTPENIATVEKEGVVYVPNSRTGQNLPLYYAYYEDVLKNPERLDVEKAVRNMRIPTLFAHGTADTSIPEKFAHTLKSWKEDAKLLLIEGANHTFGATHPFKEEKLTDYAQQLVDQSAEFLKGIKA